MTHRHYLKNKDSAKNLLHTKITRFNEKYGLRLKRISVRNQKTRWGSCSSLGNLNFNYKIIYLPEKLADYVIVHELCHLKEFNHSQKFWRWVAEVIPDYKNLRKELRKFRLDRRQNRLKLKPRLFDTR